MKTVSIIIPIYNAEPHLNHCITSVLTQTYPSIKVILINDGSIDNSGEICEAIANTDNRVKVIHQQNAGPSKARNTGIAAATGEYIQFVDADDWIDPNMTEKLVEGMRDNVQLVMCGYQLMDKSKPLQKYIPALKGIYTMEEFMQHFGELYKAILLPSPCNKLYKKEIIQDKKIRFREEFSIGEDLLFNMDYIQKCSHISIIRDQLYNYTFNRHSLTNEFNQELFDNQQMLYQKVKGFLVKHNCYSGENQQSLHTIYANGVVNSLNNLFFKDSSLSSLEKKEQIAHIISNNVVRKNIAYFKDGMQARYIGRMIRYNAINGIYSFLSMKVFMKHKMNPLFRLLKRVNK
ncbi:glycosyltransferase family 2 protein [Virgibacillus oceani]|uniref:Glycosyltransferase EpsJ n=1 Tax=Virgibacillus oceani TaxID=1479511 RepID=A0A917HB97_9BACI|nr:glycosyltransferase [Virgibacillus oceani]GGG73334.1 putative glycosyltransferase EpsJ [Virgibacillus oceani]